MTAAMGPQSDADEAPSYVLDVRAVERPDGEWVCRAEYEQLPGCIAEDPQVLVALDKVDALLERFISTARAENRPLPDPRAAFGG